MKLQVMLMMYYLESLNLKKTAHFIRRRIKANLKCFSYVVPRIKVKRKSDLRFQRDIFTTFHNMYKYSTHPTLICKLMLICQFRNKSNTIQVRITLVYIFFFTILIQKVTFTWEIICQNHVQKNISNENIRFFFHLKKRLGMYFINKSFPCTHYDNLLIAINDKSGM